MEKTSDNSRSLKSRVLVAGSWVMMGFGVSQLLRLASNLVMTRLLVPEMFGIMALTLVFLYIVTLISDIGIKPSIIRSNRGEDSDFLNTAWTLQVLRGCLITFGVLMISLLIGFGINKGYFSADSAYNSPELPMVIAVMSLSSFIAGFNSTNIVLANRKLLMGRLTLFGLIGQSSGIIFMILWAQIDQSVWPLVGGTILSALIFCVLSHVAFPGSLNRFRMEKKAFWEIFHFGKWLLLSSCVTAFVTQADRLILGDLLSARMLGVYAIAFFLVSAVKLAINQINNTVFFPLLSEIERDNAEKIASIYYRIRKSSDAFSMLVAGFLYVVADAFIEILYDDRYDEAGWMLRILSISLIVTGPIISRALYLSINKPNYVTSMITVEGITLLIGLPVLFTYGGLQWGIWLLALYSLSVLPLDLYYKRKLEILNWKKEFYMLPMILVGYALGLMTTKSLSYILF